MRARGPARIASPRRLGRQGTYRYPTCTAGRSSGGLVEVVGVLGEPVDDHHAKRDDHDRQNRRCRDHKEPPDRAHHPEDVAYHQTVSPSSEDVYARVQRGDRDDQVDDAPDDEVRVDQVARFGHPPAGARERIERAQALKTGYHEHHDGGEGEHAGSPVRCRPRRDGALHTAADSSRNRSAVLIRHVLYPFSLCVATWGLHAVDGSFDLPGVCPDLLLHLLLGALGHLLDRSLYRHLSDHYQGGLALV